MMITTTTTTSTMTRVSATIYAITLLLSHAIAFNIMDYTHYLDYLPYRQEGLQSFEDFRTAPYPPTHLRNRKMEIGSLENLNIGVEDVLISPKWPTRWPYGFEDFRPLDYARDDVTNTGVQYEYSQNLLYADHLTLIPGILRLPIRRHFILPKDKFSLAEHMSEYINDDAKVLELFATYESILPPGFNGVNVGVGWFEDEMKTNADLDDYIVQDITVDPFLPLADNYFDFVVIPANFQLFQRPLDMFQEINRVLKPGGTAFIGLKLSFWAFLGWKQGRYYVETNYLEDTLAIGSFFHYAEGFTKPAAFDLTLPEFNIVGKIKDVLYPNPRVDFYACVQARKKKDSPHGKPDDPRRKEDPGIPEIEGEKYQPKVLEDPVTKERNLAPYY